MRVNIEQVMRESTTQARQPSEVMVTDNPLSNPREEGRVSKIVELFTVRNMTIEQIAAMVGSQWTTDVGIPEEMDATPAAQASRLHRKQKHLAYIRNVLQREGLI